ncbi:MAG: phosphatidate cytidylyltransferase [Chitinophagaceae bacterium]
MNTFITRTISAFFFALIMLGGILWNEISFFILFFFIQLFALQEYIRLMKKIDSGYKGISPLHQIMIGVAGCGIMIIAGGNLFHLGNTPYTDIGIQLLLISLMITLAADLLITKNFRLRSLGNSLLGLIYLSLPFGLLVNLRLNPLEKLSAPGFLLPLVLILSIWVNDTMAYIIGSLIGKTKFFPSISPKKTWEGTIGGILLTILTAWSWVQLSGRQHLGIWMTIALLGSLVGTAGDLLESKLKRLAGVKDTGSILPGHGGLMDRFDSLLLAIPATWLLVLALR